MRFPLFGFGQTGKSRTVTSESRKNFYAEATDKPDKTVLALYGRWGLDLFASFGDTPIRGEGLQIGDFNYSVHRGILKETNNAAVFTDKGTLTTSAGVVSMCTDGNIIFIVDGANGYVYNTTTSLFTQVSDVDFVPAVSCAWIDGYFIADMRGSTDKTDWRSYQWSIDGLAWGGLDFASAEASPDPIERVYNDNRQVIFFGSVTTEFHNASGNFEEPFTRSATNEWGLAAKWSVCKIKDSIIYLGQNRMGKTQIIVLNGYTPEIVSNYEMSSIIDGYGDVSNAIGHSFMEGGHPFYVISFPSVSKTWLFDAATGLFSELTSGIKEGQYRGLFSNNYLGNTLIYDFENGNVYKTNPDTYTDNGTMIVGELISRHMFEQSYMFLSELWVDMQVGVGLSTGQGEDPQIILAISRDGGMTYGNERWRSFGRIGTNLTRAFWIRLGRSRDFTFKLRITDPVKRVITGAWTKS